MIRDPAALETLVGSKLPASPSNTDRRTKGSLFSRCHQLNSLLWHYREFTAGSRIPLGVVYRGAFPRDTHRIVGKRDHGRRLLEVIPQTKQIWATKAGARLP